MSENGNCVKLNCFYNQEVFTGIETPCNTKGSKWSLIRFAALPVFCKVDDPFLVLGLPPNFGATFPESHGTETFIGVQ